jgi:hypothetical protein
MEIVWEEPPLPTPADKTADRFWTKVRFTDACWTWTGSLNASGYGMFLLPPTRLAHRVAWAMAHPDSEMPEVLDHTCHTTECPGGDADIHRRCVNPDHLAPSTRGDNTRRGNALSAQNARKTHCVRGHEFTPENTIIGKTPWGTSRLCRSCRYWWNHEGRKATES